MINKELHLRTLASRFSTSATSYDDHASVQKSAAASLQASLPDSLPHQYILEVGCGSGQLTKGLLEKYPGIPLDAVDVAPRMIEEARNRVGDTPRWFAEDILNFQGGPYGLITSSSSLHWVQPLQTGLEHLVNMLAPGGHLVLNMMVQGTLKELHTLRNKVAPTKQPSASLPRKDEVLACLSMRAIQVDTIEQRHLSHRYDSARALLQSIHKQGLTGGQVSRGKLPLNRTELNELAELYDKQFSLPDGGVVATYETLFLSAHKE